jgi:hypothetical protein
VRRRPARRLISKGELIYALSFVMIVIALFYARSTLPALVEPISQHTKPAHLPARATATTGPFTFLTTAPSGRPVTYDPCHPIHYVVNPTGMPNDGMGLIRDGIRTISAATGLRFVEDGFTQERPNSTYRPLKQPQRYGPGWAPVLIGWVNETEYPLVSGSIVGVTRSEKRAPHGLESVRYVTGQIMLDRQDLAVILTHDDGYAAVRAVVIHELGHLVGLGHVDDPRELMAQENLGQTELGPGDRRGLAEAGKGPCWPDT